MSATVFRLEVALFFITRDTDKKLSFGPLSRDSGQWRPLDDLPIVRRILLDDFAVLEVPLLDHLL